MRKLWFSGIVLLFVVSDFTTATSANMPLAPQLRWLVQNDTHGNQSPENPARKRNDAAPKSESKPELNTLNDLFGAIRRCYVPPRLIEARPGMRMTVQFAYTREGEIFGKPRILYESPGASPVQQSAYRLAIAAALARCSPLPFSKSLGNAVAGRVFSIQFVDERNLRGA